MYFGADIARAYMNVIDWAANAWRWDSNKKSRDRLVDRVSSPVAPRS